MSNPNAAKGRLGARRTRIIPDAFLVRPYGIGAQWQHCLSAADTNEVAIVERTLDRRTGDARIAKFLRTNNGLVCHHAAELRPLVLPHGNHVTNPLIKIHIVRGFVTNDL